MNDIVIIGGGIAGLYAYYHLLNENKNMKIQLFEKENYFGGRIKTVVKKINGKKYQYEAGAGRLNKNHHLFLHLIKELNLTKDLVQISGDSVFRPTPSFRLADKFPNKNAYYFIDKVIKASKKESKRLLISMTFKKYASTILTKDELYFMLSSSGYYGELVFENAFDAVKIFREGIRNDLFYYILKNGFSSVIKELVKRIRAKGGKLHLHSELESITKNEEGYMIKINGENVKTKKLLLALPKPALMKLRYLRNYRTDLESIRCKELCRIYSIFPDVWFQDVPKTTTNNNLRFIIPVDKKNGLIMSSYTDSKYALYWKQFRENPSGLKRELLLELKEIFPDVTDSTYNVMCYWGCGVGYWKENSNSERLSKKVLHLEKDLFIIGENYSTNQGWIEGALETVHRFIEKLNLSKI